MNKAKKAILILGLLWCGTCALFPPRQYIDGVHDARIIPSHEFLFSPRFQMFFYQAHLGNYYSVEVNGGRLFAEIVLVMTITGIVFLVQEEWDKCLRKGLRDAQLGAPPNGGPTKRLGDSGVGGGPPSVS